MSTDHLPTASAAATAPSDPAGSDYATLTRSPRRVALVLLFALVSAALVARTVFLLWEPPFTGALDFDVIAALGASYWLMQIYVGGPAFAMTWIGLAIFIALLARGRSTAVTLVSAVLTGVGGLIFALVITAEGLPFAYAADPATFSDAEGRAAFDALNANLGLLAPTIIGTQLSVAAGVLIALVVALVTRALPRWFAIAGLVYLVAYLALPLELFPRGVLVASDIVQSLLVLAIAWFSLRAALSHTADTQSRGQRAPKSPMYR